MRIRFRLLVIPLVSLAIAACQSPSNQPSASPASSASFPPTDCQTVEHVMGETEVCGQPKTIVVLGSSMLESLMALEVQPAAYADYLATMTGNYDNPSQQIPYLGNYITGQLVNIGSVAEPNLEAIAKVQPDLILGTQFNAGQYGTFSQLAPTLLLPWADADENLKAIAQVMNQSEKAEQLLAKKAQQIADARETFAALAADHPNVLMLHSGNLQDIYFGNQVFGLCASLVRALGFELISLPGFDEFNSDAPAVISVETLAQFDEADLILMFGSNFSQAEQLNGTDDFADQQMSDLKEAWEESAIAQSLDASQAGRVYFMPYALCAGLPGTIGTERYLEELKQQLRPLDK